MIRETLVDAVRAALGRAGFPEPAGGIVLTPSDRPEHGDWTTNVALQIAKPAGVPPREAAQRLAVELGADPPPHLARVEIAGPGFVNLHLAPTWLHDVLRAVVARGGRFGHGEAFAGQRINLEFVSANPTGPLHAGGGRWVAVGDALANLLAAQGAEVHREYYLNDAGSQLDLFGASLHARYRNEPLPEDGYQGQYLVEMADRMRAELGDDVTVGQAREWGYREVVGQLQRDLGRIGVVFDTWFSERTLHERGDVARVLEALDVRGATFHQDGALWLRATDYGDQRARVLLGQLVKLLRGGAEVRISKRAGTVVTLADILDEVDPDVCRLTFLLQGIDTAQTFDLEVVTSQSMENPVYYVQYAHARIASIARQAAARGVERLPVTEVNLAPLVHERELDLLRALSVFPDVVEEAAALRAPHRVSTWVRDFASRFHGFYRDCRVISDDPALTQPRLWLAEASRIGLANALAILGVGAPEEMTRLDEAEGAAQ